MALVLKEAEQRAMGGAAESRKWLDTGAAGVVSIRSRLRGAELRWAWGRLFTFLVAAAGWIPISAEPVAAMGVALAGLAGFAVCVRRHRARRGLREAA